MLKCVFAPAGVESVRLVLCVCVTTLNKDAQMGLLLTILSVLSCTVAGRIKLGYVTPLGGDTKKPMPGSSRALSQVLFLLADFNWYPVVINLNCEIPAFSDSRGSF